MASVRLDKISRLIQKELAMYFQLEAKNIVPGFMVSVTVVRISPDLSVAKVYLSVFPSSGSQEVLAKIKEVKGAIRRELGFKVKMQLRIVPDLYFFIDDSLDYINKIDDLLKH